MPAVVRSTEDNERLELALIENMAREDLNPVEEAKAYEVLIDQMGLSQSDLAKRVGRDRSSITNSLRLLKLPQKIQDMVRAGALTAGHAKAIMAISDAETQIKVASEVVEKLLSVRETELRAAEVSRRRGKGRRGNGRPAADGSVDPNVAAAQDRLCRTLATKVRIVSLG